jgi:hypothetical protein
MSSSNGFVEHRRHRFQSQNPLSAFRKPLHFMPSHCANFVWVQFIIGSRGVTMLKAIRSRVRFSMSLDFSSDLILPATLGPGVDSASNRNEYQECSLGSKKHPAHKDDNLTAICEPVFYKMWKPRRLTTVLASTICYKDIFTFFQFFHFVINTRDTAVA